MVGKQQKLFYKKKKKMKTLISTVFVGLLIFHFCFQVLFFFYNSFCLKNEGFKR